MLPCVPVLEWGNPQGHALVHGMGMRWCLVGDTQRGCAGAQGGDAPVPVWGYQVVAVGTPQSWV